MQYIAVYCGAKLGADQRFYDGAIALGELMAARGRGLIYGGGNVGMMGAIANAILDNGGSVIGVIPEALNQRERQHPNLTELHIVKSMHERKALMTSRADGFIAMPGGFGTLEELFEMITWSQLNIHNKPICIFNIARFYDPLLTMLDHVVAHGFITPTARQIVQSADTPEAVLAKLENYTPYLENSQLRW